MCGGTDVEPMHDASATGLSPRVRGNPARRRCATSPAGSIPACAGEPLVRLGKMLHLGVYPRVCGGTPLGDGNLRPGCGLSPRVRGNPAGRCACRRWRGSIPACAGEPVLDPLLDVHLGVYPRVCGGTSSTSAPSNRSYGLSPRVRGNPVSYSSRTTWRGSIPACAGEPLAPSIASSSPIVCVFTSSNQRGDAMSASSLHQAPNCTSPDKRRPHLQFPWAPRPGS